MVTGKLVLMAMIMLEESQSNQEEREDEVLREKEIVSFIVYTGAVIVTLVVICQVVTSLVFCWRARKVK